MAARQLASRGRRRVHAPGTTSDPERTVQREVVHAFLAASRNGDFEALVGLLDPDTVIRAEAAAVQAGATSEVRGAAALT
jgi:ketosteroid isomerase-like protein